MKKILFLLATAGLVWSMIGCDWDSTGEDGGWDSGQVYWVDLSGTYNGSGPGGLLVSEFEYNIAPIGSNTVGVGQTAAPTAVADDTSTVGASQTQLSGTLSTLPVTPGSLTLVMRTNSIDTCGVFVDDGTGGLSGMFNQVGVGVGSINYTTGVWALQLDPPGVLDAANVKATYTYSITGDAPTRTGNPPAGSSVGPIFTAQVTHMSSAIELVDSNGDIFKGRVTGVEPQQTNESDTEREVAQSLSFRATGTSGGKNVEIIGAFQVVQTVYFSQKTENKSGVGGVDSTSGMTEVYRISTYSVSATWMEEGGQRGSFNGVGPSNTKVEMLSNTGTPSSYVYYYYYYW
jgi:hypothetical protein